MTLLDLRASRIDIRETVGDDLSIVVTADTNVSTYTIQADVYRNGTSIATFTDVVSGAGSNIVTLSLTDAQTTTIGNQGGLTWSMSVTVDGATNQWAAGDFQLYTVGSAKTGTGSTAITVTTGGTVTASVSVGGLPLADADGRYVNTAGDTMTGALTLASDPAGSLDAATKQYVDTFGLGGSPASSASAVSIADAGGYYTGTDVETALAEIGAGTTLDGRYSSHDRRPFLTDLARRAAVGPYRILLSATSIGSFDNSSIRVFVEHLKAIYRDSGTRLIKFGIYGGTFDTAPTAAGWVKQRYYGAEFTRMRGATGAATIGVNLAGNEFVLEYGVEADSAAFEVLIDGVSQGTVGASGTQASASATFTTASDGPHKFEIVAPAGAGYAYIHTLEARSTTRVGVEALDFSIGGSGLRHMTTLMDKTVPQVDGIPIVGNVGLNYYFDRPDVDCFIVEHIVNDRTASATLAANAESAALITRGLNKSLVFVTEPMYLFSSDTGYQSGYKELLDVARRHPHVTLIDWHGAVYTPNDVAGFQARYWPTADKTHPNQAAYDVLNTMLTDEATVPQIPHRLLSSYELARLAAFDVNDGYLRKATIEGVDVTLGLAEGTALAVRSSDTTRVPVERRQVYRYNIASAYNKSTQTEIYASALSDQYGKYLDHNSTGRFIGVSPGDVAGDSLTITIRANGIFYTRIGSGQRFADMNGNLLPINVSTDITDLRFDVGVASPPLTFAFKLVRGSGTGNTNIQFKGRLYDLTFSQSSVPLLDVV